jgi:hypothetical protein
VIAQESAQVEVRGESTLVWRRRSVREKARRLKCAVREYWCGGEGVKGTLGCAQGEVRSKIALVWRRKR